MPEVTVKVMQRRDHEPREVSDLWKVEKAGKQILPQSFQEGCCPTDPF